MRVYSFAAQRSLFSLRALREILGVPNQDRADSWMRLTTKVA